MNFYVHTNFLHLSLLDKSTYCAFIKSNFEVELSTKARQEI